MINNPRPSVLRRILPTVLLAVVFFVLCHQTALELSAEDDRAEKRLVTCLHLAETSQSPSTAKKYERCIARSLNSQSITATAKKKKKKGKKKKSKKKKGKKKKKKKKQKASDVPGFLEVRYVYHSGTNSFQPDKLEARITAYAVWPKASFKKSANRACEGLGSGFYQDRRFVSDLCELLPISNPVRSCPELLNGDFGTVLGTSVFLDLIPDEERYQESLGRLEETFGTSRFFKKIKKDVTNPCPRDN